VQFRLHGTSDPTPRLAASQSRRSRNHREIPSHFGSSCLVHEQRKCSQRSANPCRPRPGIVRLGSTQEEVKHELWWDLRIIGHQVRVSRRSSGGARLRVQQRPRRRRRLRLRRVRRIPDLLRRPLRQSQERSLQLQRLRRSVRCRGTVL
jgi:hypothetical protein